MPQLFEALRVVFSEFQCTLRSRIHDTIMHDTLKQALGNLKGLCPSCKRLSRGQNGAVSVFIMYCRVEVASIMYFRAECRVPSARGAQPAGPGRALRAAGWNRAA